jgi:biopolymer transport protein ExbB
MDTLIQSFMAGGVFMWAILAVGIAVVAITVERSIALYKSYKFAPADMRHRLMSFIALGQFQEAKSYVDMSAAGTAIGRVASAGLTVRHAGGGDEEVQARMDEALGQEISQIDRRTGFLAVFGNVATLLGLLGTVTGLIASFSGVTNANPAERALLLGKGISEALNTTAFGLAVAIPALVAYALMQNRTERIVSSITDEASRIFHDLLFQTDSRRINSDKKDKVTKVETEENTFQRSN